jgi:predicted small secreted protein
MEFGMDPFRAPLRPLAVIALIALFFVPACETIEGAGRDLSAAGQAVTQEAQAAQ